MSQTQAPPTEEQQQPPAPREGEEPIAIVVDGVTKRYGNKTVLDQIKLDVRQGETLVILGGSGSGKSTLLRLMIGNVKPDGGEVIGLGKCISSMTDGELAEYRKSIGVLFQSGALFNSMTVADNVALPLREHRDLPGAASGIRGRIKAELGGLGAAGDREAV